MRTIRLFLLFVGLLMWVSGCAGNRPIPEPDPGTSMTNQLGMGFVYIPPGNFIAGSPVYQVGRFDDEARHEVDLTKGFYLQTTEVTQGQWEAVMMDNPSHFSQCGRNCPVENVSWNDVQAFIQRLNERGEGHYRLPTEAEWEYACRLGRKKNLVSRTVGGLLGIVNSLYYAFWEEELIPSQECLPTDKANYNGQFPCAGCPQDTYRQTTLPVGSLEADQLGLYDMVGNVYEWCQDNYGPYQCADTFPLYAVCDPVGVCPSNLKLYKGGSWMSCFRYCRPAYRGKARPDYKAKNIGFRLVKEN